MSEIPADNTDKEKTPGDNDRKFIAGQIDSQFLEEHCEKPFYLTVDWIVTGEDQETKVARKEFDDGRVEILHIMKVTVDGDRTPQKRPITDKEYQDYLRSSLSHLEKRRYEFEYTQNGIVFLMKYDVYAGGKFCMLEVDAVSKQEHERERFDYEAFDLCSLEEVTHQLQYYGYRMVDVINELEDKQPTSS